MLAIFRHVTIFCWLFRNTEPSAEGSDQLHTEHYTGRKRHSRCEIDAYCLR